MEKETKKEEMKEEQTEQEQVADSAVEEETTAEEVQENEVARLKKELSEMEDQYLRAQAEIVNMRNRFQKERADLIRYRSQELAKELLPALDNLERALKSEVQDEQGANLKKGIEMVYESLQQALKQAGVEEIKALGEVFDPTLHQAVQTVPASDEHKADEIVEVLQKGYKLHDRVIRPTMVMVAQ